MLVINLETGICSVKPYYLPALCLLRRPSYKKLILDHKQDIEKNYLEYEAVGG